MGIDVTQFDAVHPVDAATVVLVREDGNGSDPWQCYMVRRPVRSDFAADVYVFPGGKVDKADYDASDVAVRRREHSVGMQEPLSTAIKIAAIRELFEEVGILLAYQAGGRTVVGDIQRLQRFREPIEKGEMTLLDLARKENLLFATDALQLFSRWVTPVDSPRRYDTWFFAARLPHGQLPCPHASETTDAIWISPTRALERFRAGSFPLVFATEKHLERLSEYASMEDMVAAIEPAQLEPVIPRVVNVDGVRGYLLPGDPGY